MTVVILVLVVLFQVALFQFIAPLANRSVIRGEIGALGDDVPEPVRDHARRAWVVRMALGVVLACLALVPLTGLIGATVGGKLLLTGVSIISAIAFLVTMARDRKIMLVLADALPETSVRRASLERRTIGQWYHPAFEAVPIAIFIATALFLIDAPGLVEADSYRADPRVEIDRTRIFVPFVLQGLVVFGALFYTLRRGVDITSMAQHIPSLRNRPELSLRLGEELAGTQLRYFMFAKIGIALLLGTAVVDKVLIITGHTAATVWDTLRWCIVGVLMIGFFFYLRRVVRISRRMLGDSGPKDEKPTSANTF